MATFPALATGAVAQYPLESSVQFQTQSVSFLNGDSQRYRLQGPGLRRWAIRLDLLSDSELGALISFTEQQGVAPFAFSDPATGNNVPKCVIGGYAFNASTQGESNGNAAIVIEEIV